MRVRHLKNIVDTGENERHSRRFGPSPEAIAWFLIALSFPVLALIKQGPLDLPWHLATGRLAHELGSWPIRNTFSYTFPDYPLYQQYPVFQGALYAVFRLGGWRALSVLLCLAWGTAVLLFIRWAGPPGRARVLHLGWMFAIFTLQTRMALRPDLLSLLLLALMLFVIDGYRARRREFMVLVPVVHWIWMNSHQLFLLSFAVQTLFLVSLVLARWGRFGVDRADAGLPIWPVAAALVASLGLSFATPLGWQIVRVSVHTAESLTLHRHDVQEFARLWSDSTWLVLFLVLAVPSAFALLRTWKAWSPFEVGLWLLTCGLALAAIRGLVFFIVLAPALIERALARRPLELSLPPRLQRGFRWLALALTGALAASIVYQRLLVPPEHIGDAEPGLGRSTGDWLDASLSVLRADPPPGHMMNVPWTLANVIIWAWPEQPVFVDPRLESYPRPFLLDAMASYKSDAVMDRLIAEYHPGWIFAGHCNDDVRARLVRLARSGKWDPTYADSQTLVLVRRAPETDAYRRRHVFAPGQVPGDLVSDEGRRADQKLCYARLLAALGS